MNFRILAKAALGCLALLGTAGSLTGLEVTIGGTQIELPLPEGYVDLQQEDPQIMGIFEATCPPFSRLLCVFVDPDELTKVAASEALGLEHFYNVQVMRQFEKVNFTDETFAELRDELKTGIDAAMEEAKEKIEKLFQTSFERLDISNIDLSNLDLLLLGIDLDEPEAIGYTMLIKAKFAGQDIVVATEVIAAKCREKVLYLYAAAKYEDEESVETARKMGRDFLNALREANQPKAD